MLLNINYLSTLFQREMATAAERLFDAAEGEAGGQIGFSLSATRGS